MVKTAQTLFALIQKLLPLLEQFLYALESEKQALATLDTQKLLQITEDKNHLLNQMVPLTTQLAESLPENTSLSQYIRPHLKLPEERESLEHFIHLSEQAEKLHLENGATLMRLAQINEGLLNILLGRQTDTPTYDDKIKGRRPNISGTTLGKA